METGDSEQNFLVPGSDWLPLAEVPRNDGYTKGEPWTDDYIDDGLEVPEAMGGHFELGHGLGLYAMADIELLEITSPQEFTRYMSELEPGTPMAEDFKNQSLSLVSGALRRASSIIFRRENSTVTSFLGAPNGVLFDLDIHPAYQNPDVIPLGEQAAYATDLACAANPLAEALWGIDAPRAVTAALDELIIAREQGMLQEWAGLYMIRLLGHSNLTIGTERMSSRKDWDHMTTIFQRLKQLAPDSPFTELVRATVTLDLKDSLKSLSADGSNVHDDTAKQVVRLAMEQVEYALPYRRA